MLVSEAPSWIRAFLSKKADWWLEMEDQLKVLSVNEENQTARVLKDGFVYTLDPRRDYIR